MNHHYRYPVGALVVASVFSEYGCVVIEHVDEHEEPRYLIREISFHNEEFQALASMNCNPFLRLKRSCSSG
jgi:hypothetical protein